MKTMQGKMAQDAITALEHRAEAAERQVVANEQVIKRQDQEIAALMRTNEKIGRLMYESTSRSITSYMQVTNDYDPCFDVQRIRLEPKSVQMVLTRRELFDAKRSLEVIDHHIERILQMHTDDLRKQLRAAVWPRR